MTFFMINCSHFILSVSHSSLRFIDLSNTSQTFSTQATKLVNLKTKLCIAIASLAKDPRLTQDQKPFFIRHKNS